MSTLLRPLASFDSCCVATLVFSSRCFAFFLSLGPARPFQLPHKVHSFFPRGPLFSQQPVALTLKERAIAHSRHLSPCIRCPARAYNLALFRSLSRPGGPLLSPASDRLPGDGAPSERFASACSPGAGEERWEPPPSGTRCAWAPRTLSLHLRGRVGRIIIAGSGTVYFMDLVRCTSRDNRREQH